MKESAGCQSNSRLTKVESDGLERSPVSFKCIWECGPLLWPHTHVGIRQKEREKNVKQRRKPYRDVFAQVKWLLLLTEVDNIKIKMLISQYVDARNKDA